MIQVRYSFGFNCFVAETPVGLYYFADDEKGRTQLLEWVKRESLRPANHKRFVNEKEVELISPAEAKELQDRFLASGGQVTVKGKITRLNLDDLEIDI